jgi:hypothetical protein
MRGPLHGSALILFRERPLGEQRFTDFVRVSDPKHAPRNLGRILGRRIACSATASVAVALLFFGCATYRAAPLSPTNTERNFEARSLTNAELCNYLRANSGAGISSCPSARWDLAGLTLVAFFYSPDLAVAEAKLNVARSWDHYGRPATESPDRSWSRLHSQRRAQLCALGDRRRRFKFPHRNGRQARSPHRSG